MIVAALVLTSQAKQAAEHLKPTKVHFFSLVLYFSAIFLTAKLPTSLTEEVSPVRLQEHKATAIEDCAKHYEKMGKNISPIPSYRVALVD